MKYSFQFVYHKTGQTKLTLFAMSEFVHRETMVRPGKRVNLSIARLATPDRRCLQWVNLSIARLWSHQMDVVYNEWILKSRDSGHCKFSITGLWWDQVDVVCNERSTAWSNLVDCRTTCPWTCSSTSCTSVWRPSCWKALIWTRSLLY